MKEQLLWIDASQKTLFHKASGSWRWIKIAKGWQRSTNDGKRWSLAFQLDLSESAADLYGIDQGTLGAGLNHQLQRIEGEITD
jgi:hypothetical protein